MPITAGQRWTYRTPAGFEESRILVGAVVSFADSEPVICCMVTGAPRRLPDATVDAVTIPFLPMSQDAFLSSVVAEDGSGEVDDVFRACIDGWLDDPRGMSAFTVPFEGYLDRMIATQMAAIVGQSA